MRFATYDQSAKLVSEVFGVSVARAESSLAAIPHPAMPGGFQSPPDDPTLIVLHPAPSEDASDVK